MRPSWFLWFAAGLAALLAGGCAHVSKSSKPAPPPDISSLHAQDDIWLGCTRHRFTVDGCECWLVEPKTPLAGNHWDWWLMFPGVFPERTGAIALLNRGYYFAYMSVGDTFGSPAALAHLDRFYEAMTKIGLKPKVALVGISRGGLYAYNWAARGSNASHVSVIYGDAPVCSFASWPYEHGSQKPGDVKEWAKLMATYGFTSNAEALACPTQPIHEVDRLAATHIPLVTVVGDVDQTVPYNENTAILERRYHELGETITVFHKANGDHHPHGLDDPTPVVDLIVAYDR